MLNQDIDSVVLVKGWKKGASWSFPRGKINKDEPDLECAIREVYEETGFDIHGAGLVASDNVKSIEVTMREQHMRLYVFRGVPMDAQFEAKTRKEISKIQWYKLSDLPTLKKGKNQQDGRGDELAINANRFYMVAPFLNPLKKWILQQKKIDKREANGQLQPEAPTDIQEPEEPPMAPPADGSVSAMKLTETERLLASLRQSRQVTGSLAIPELSQSLALGAEQPMPRQPSMPNTQENFEPKIVQPTIQETTRAVGSGVDREKSKALFALLKGDNVAGTSRVPPQTPMEQVIEHPVMPPSPKHHHAPAARDRTVPLVSPIGHFAPHNETSLELQQSLRQSVSTLQTKPAPRSGVPPSRKPLPPSGAVPDHRSQPNQASSTTHNQPSRIAVPAPYRRVGDPMSAQASQTKDLPSSIPAASTLPPPKLTSHSSALLNLFRAGHSVKAPSEVSAVASSTSQEASPPSRRVTSQPGKGYMSGVEDVSSATDQELRPKSRGGVFEMPTMNGPATGVPSTTHRVQSKNTGGYAPQRPNSSYAKDSQDASHPPATTDMTNIANPANPRTSHQATLLDLFRNPSGPSSEAPKATKPSLEPPPTPIELSAIPSPGHSRGPSHTNGLPVEPAGDMSHIFPISGSQVPTKAVPTARKSTISATVDGPLNVPQFDMLAKKSSNPAENGAPPASQRPPVQILSRPAQSPNAAVPSSNNGVSKTVKTKPAPPRNMGPPATPTKQAATPASQYQPQILRRPPHVQPSQPETIHRHPPHIQPSQPDSVLSPIEPLPSPKHPLGGRGKQPQDHKASLLSLFTRPSPMTTPTPTPASVDPEALISPPGIGSPSFENRNKAAGSNFPSASLERARTGSLAPSIGDGSQTPRATTTPKDKSFLLGYLEDVVRSEKRY